VGQATRARHGQRFAGWHAAGELPDAYAVTYKTAGSPPDAATFADRDGDAVPAADRHAAADRDAACDEPACHRTADPDAHLVREHAGNAVAAAGGRDGQISRSRSRSTAMASAAATAAAVTAKAGR
jgi:hypothetical protein